MWTMNFQMFKLDLEKAEEPEIKLPTSFGSLEKQESSRKTSTSVLLTMPKPLTVWITTNCGKFWKRWDADHLTCLLSNLYAGQEATVRTGHGTTDWFQIGKGVKAVYCHPAYLKRNLDTKNYEKLWIRGMLHILYSLSILMDIFSFQACMHWFSFPFLRIPKFELCTSAPLPNP